MRQLPAHRQHDLAVAGGVGHQLQHLLVGFALDGHSVDAEQLVPGAQATVLLGGAQRHDGADVHLRRAERFGQGGVTEQQHCQRCKWNVNTFLLGLM